MIRNWVEKDARHSHSTSHSVSDAQIHTHTQEYAKTTSKVIDCLNQIQIASFDEMTGLRRFSAQTFFHLNRLTHAIGRKNRQTNLLRNRTLKMSSMSTSVDWAHPRSPTIDLQQSMLESIATRKKTHFVLFLWSSHTPGQPAINTNILLVTLLKRVKQNLSTNDQNSSCSPNSCSSKSGSVDDTLLHAHAVPHRIKFVAQSSPQFVQQNRQIFRNPK